MQSELIGKALRVGCALPSSTGFFEQVALPIARMSREGNSLHFRWIGTAPRHCRRAVNSLARKRQIQAATNASDWLAFLFGSSSGLRVIMRWLLSPHFQRGACDDSICSGGTNDRSCI